MLLWATLAKKTEFFWKKPAATKRKLATYYNTQNSKRDCCTNWSSSAKKTLNG
ncbi:15687_t:CDS:2 [Dentiscutata erythropus]|uniref:15687_t:CDS:1 n=1 Tax=Dentiscutata erythropus TaxID=1348616 RepID=A0A9N9ADN3_9GLOM|nr:15687_t:CDS:2 [Dentiscutata erythropus]